MIFLLSVGNEEVGAAGEGMLRKGEQRRSQGICSIQHTGHRALLCLQVFGQVQVEPSRGWGWVFLKVHTTQQTLLRSHGMSLQAVLVPCTPPAPGNALSVCPEGHLSAGLVCDPGQLTQLSPGCPCPTLVFWQPGLLPGSRDPRIPADCKPAREGFLTDPSQSQCPGVVPLAEKSCRQFWCINPNFGVSRAVQLCQPWCGSVAHPALVPAGIFLHFLNLSPGFFTYIFRKV